MFGGEARSVDMDECAGSIAVLDDAARGLGMTPFSGKSWCANAARVMSIGSPRWRSMQLGMA